MKKIKNIFYAASIVTAVYFCLKYPIDIGESVENSINQMYDADNTVHVYFYVHNIIYN